MRMRYQAPLITIIILSPFLLSLLLSAANSNSDEGIGIYLALLIGVPIVAVSGLIIRAVTYKVDNPKMSLYSYLFPAILVNAYLLFIVAG